MLASKTERQRALFLATQARDNAPHFQHSEIGYNYRLSNILAALGNAQLQNLEERVNKRRAIYEAYGQAFEKLNAVLGKSIVKSTHEEFDVHSNRWLSTFLVQPHQSITATSWRDLLEKNGIESRPLWKPMHQQPVFSNYLFFGDHTSDRIFEQGICLPSGFDLSTDQINEITGLILSLYK